MRAAAGMPDGKLRRGQGAGRPSDHRKALDAQGIEKLHQDIGLVGGRGVVGKGAAEVAEARGCDDPEAALAQAVGEEQPLVEASPGAVDHHERQPVPGDGILQRAGRRLDHAAAPGDPCLRARQSRAIGAGSIAPACKGEPAETKKYAAPRWQLRLLTSAGAPAHRPRRQSGPSHACHRRETSRGEGRSGRRRRGARGRSSPRRRPRRSG